MQKRKLKKALSLTLCMMLIAVMAFITSGCGDKKNQTETESPIVHQSQGTDTESSMSQQSPQMEQESWEIVGEGENRFQFTVTDAEGNESFFEIHTNKTIVGDALLELQLISGEEGAYGLYVKTVNGITADYDVDKTYWAFYIDGEYATSGVDTTEITQGEMYSFKVQK